MSRHVPSTVLPASFLLLIVLAPADSVRAQRSGEAFKGVQRDSYGAIIRGDLTVKQLALVFTGDEFGESAGPILDVLKHRGIKGAFFVTGRFLRSETLRPLVARMADEGHYLGPHSDGHLLYCDW